MFLVDNILLSPVCGICAIFREIHKAAQEAMTSEAEAIRTRLGELYMQLETGRITEADFDNQEKDLLDRLDAIESGGPEAEDGEAEEPADDTESPEEQRSWLHAGHSS